MSASRFLTVVITLFLGVSILANGLANPEVADAKSPYHGTWDGVYPASLTNDNVTNGTGDTCQLCHQNAPGNDGWNAYGEAIRQADIISGGQVNAADIQSVEPLDSDGDGVSNLDEINADTQPGWLPGSVNTIYFKTAPDLLNQPPPAGILGALDAPTLPGAPTAATAVAGDTQADVSWTAPVDTGGGILTYTVTTSPTDVGPLTTGDATPSATITGLTNGTLYTFTVQATSSAGTGPASTASNSVTPFGLPGAPTGASAIPGDSQADVSWSAAADNGDPISLYTVYPNPADVPPVSSAASPVTVAGLTNGTAYTFTVTATNAAGEGSASTASGAVTPTGPPTEPLSVTAAGGDAQATVNWSAPANNGGSPIDHYTVITNPADVPPADTTGAPTSLLITGLTNGQAYTFTVTATNGLPLTGPASAPSNSVSPSSSGTAPDPPTSVIATAGNGQVGVTWTAPASDGGSAITSYTVITNPAHVGPFPTGNTTPSATITGLTNGQAYTFTATTTNDIGTGAASAPSNSATPVGAATAPTGVSATAGDAQASVTWTAPASDGGSAITSYTVITNPAHVGPFPTGNTTPSATITGLTNGQAYTFTVTATNGEGEGPASAPSNSVTPTPAATVPGAPTGVSATPGDTLVQVTWTAPASDGGSLITGYTVYPNPADVPPVPAGTTTATVTGLTNGTPYTFTVTATNSVGEGPASAASNIATPQPTGGAIGGGPHGGYGATGGVDSGLPDQCAGCHRAHTAVSNGKLLIASSPYALCLTCHNGTGSRLDVVDGVKLVAQYDAAAVSYDADGILRASVAPAASVWMAAGAGSTVYTIALRNGGASPVTVTPTISETLAGTNFTASGLSSTDPSWTGTTIDVPAAVSGVFGTAYVDLTTTTLAAVAGDQLLTTVSSTDGTNTVVVTVHSQVGTPNSDVTLNGGGFSFMNGAAITSRHNADPADNSTNPWGYNTANTGQNTDAMASALQCSSCHNPHGNTNYRLLRETINAQTVVVKSYFAGSFVATEGSRGLEAGAPADKYTVDYYGSQGGGGAPTGGGGSMSSLCGACHTAYPSTGAAVASTAGGVTHYRHTTEMPYTWWTNPQTSSPSDNPETQPGGGFDFTGFPALRLASNGGQADTIVTCLTCHRAHGTSATMSGWAASTTAGGLNPYEVSAAQTAISTSTLLFTDNRGMCQACHQWGQ